MGLKDLYNCELVYMRSLCTQRDCKRVYLSSRRARVGKQVYRTQKVYYEFSAFLSFQCSQPSISFQISLIKPSLKSPVRNRVLPTCVIIFIPE